MVSFSEAVIKYSDKRDKEFILAQSFKLQSIVAGREAQASGVWSSCSHYVQSEEQWSMCADGAHEKVEEGLDPTLLNPTFMCVLPMSLPPSVWSVVPVQWVIPTTINVCLPSQGNQDNSPQPSPEASRWSTTLESFRLIANICHLQTITTRQCPKL